MKAAYHFIADHREVGDLYARSIIRTLTGAALSPPPLSLWTKVFVGDLLLHRLGMDRREEDNTVIETPNTRKLKRAIDLWLHSDSPVVTRLRDDVSQLVLRHRVFVVCLESVDEDSALRLHARMSHYEPYCGMMEVDEASVVHWYLYSGALTPFGRMSGTRATLFWNGLDEESKNHAFVAALRESGLQSCTFEALNGRYTLFDANHNPDQARRIAIWKRRAGNLLAFVADNAVSRLSDIAPELGDKLFAALITFEAAETNEHYAQVMATCRRIFERVADSLFPARETCPGGRDLGPGKYKNRILAFADQEKASETNAALVSISVDVWAKQLDKLLELANNGVHAEVLREEARRCLLRTILVLDDIVSLREDPFEVRARIDAETIRRLIDS